MRPFFQNHHIVLKFIELISLMLVLTLAVVLPLGVLGLFGVNTSTITMLRLTQVLQDVATFILPCLILAFFWQPKPMQWMGLSRGANWKYFVAVVLLMITALPFINLLAWLNQQLSLPSFLQHLELWMQQMEEQMAQLTEAFLQADGVLQMLINLCVMALLPALSEEIFFRGTLQNLLTRERADNKKNSHAIIAIWVAAIIFSAIHLQFYGFFPRMLLGAFFGYLFYWSGSLWLPIVAHFTNNAMVVILYYITQRCGLSEEYMDSLGTGDTLWLGILCGVLVNVGIFLLYRSFSRLKTSRNL